MKDLLIVMIWMKVMSMLNFGWKMFFFVKDRLLGCVNNCYIGIGCIR